MTTSEQITFVSLSFQSDSTEISTWLNDDKMSWKSVDKTSLHNNRNILFIKERLVSDATFT